jgi:putative transposase
MATELVIAALNMAPHTCKPESVIHHSDLGSQNTSVAFRQPLPRDGRSSVLGHGGRCLRQHDSGELLRHA